MSGNDESERHPERPPTNPAPRTASVSRRQKLKVSSRFLTGECPRSEEDRRRRSEPANVTARVTDSDGNVATAGASGVNLSNVSLPGPTAPNARLQNLQVGSQPRAGDTVRVVAQVENLGSRDTVDVGLVVDGRVVDRKRASVPADTTAPVAFAPAFPTPGERLVTVAVLNLTGDPAAALPPQRVAVQPAKVPVEIDPRRRTTAVGATERFNVTVGDVPNGVGRVKLAVQVNNSTVANVTDVAVLGGSGATSIHAGGGRATVDASGLATDNGTVPVVRVNLTARQVGWANLSVTVRALGDEDGNDYAVSRTDDGDLRVTPPGAAPISAILTPERIEGMECSAEACDAVRFAGLTDDERALLHVRRDGAPTLYYLAVVEGGRVAEFRAVEGPSAVDRTANVRTDAETVRGIWAAENRSAALKGAVRQGDITVDGAQTGVANRARLFAAGALRWGYDVVTGIADAIGDLF